MTVCACSVVVKPGRGHAPWCDHSTQTSYYSPPEDMLTAEELAVLAEAGVDSEDWEKYAGELKVEEAAKIRSVGVLGSAYRRYVDKADMRDIDVMAQLASIGITSSRYLDWKTIGISDVDIVSKAHMAGFDADGYLGLLKRCRKALGAALAERILEQHPVPALTVEAAEEGYFFGEFLLYLSEAELKRVVWRCENGERAASLMNEGD